VAGSRPGIAARGTPPGTGPEAEGAAAARRGTDEDATDDAGSARPTPDRRAEQAGQQSDHDTWTPPTREREPDY
ncbi:cation:proton antiporter, partial [Clavibacter michiganensis subsp. insidiosus]